jgi:hypothetical protein
MIEQSGERGDFYRRLEIARQNSLDKSCATFAAFVTGLSEFEFSYNDFVTLRSVTKSIRSKTQIVAADLGFSPQTEQRVEVVGFEILVPEGIADELKASKRYVQAPTLTEDRESGYLSRGIAHYFVPDPNNPEIIHQRPRYCGEVETLLGTKAEANLREMISAEPEYNHPLQLRTLYFQKNLQG